MPTCSTDATLDWSAARARLVDIIANCLSRGSLGISEWFDSSARQLWLRLNAGERTLDLYISIKTL